MSAYDSQWSAFRCWTRFGAVFFLAALGAVAGVVYLAMNDGPRAAIVTCGAVAIVSTAAFPYFIWRQARFRCPRCSNPYARRVWWTSRPFPNSCSSCGLKLYG